MTRSADSQSRFLICELPRSLRLSQTESERADVSECATGSSTSMRILT